MRVPGLSSVSVKLSGLAMSGALAFAGLTFSTAPADAVVYCTYVGYPANCVARAGVVLRPRPVARAATREAVRPGTPANRGGPVDRAGRR
jgi:hypothetical protein